MSLYDYWMEKSAEGEESLMSKIKKALKRSSLGEGAKVIRDVGKAALNEGTSGAKRVAKRYFSVPGLSDSDHKNLRKKMDQETAMKKLEKKMVRNSGVEGHPITKIRKVEENARNLGANSNQNPAWKRPKV